MCINLLPRNYENICQIDYKAEIAQHIKRIELTDREAARIMKQLLKKAVVESIWSAGPKRSFDKDGNHLDNNSGFKHRMVYLYPDVVELYFFGDHKQFKEWRPKKFSWSF